jgi:membrane-associated phospholipid phosphatase
LKLFKSLKQFLLKYKHGVILSYFFIYITWFMYLERTITKKFYPVYSKLDDFIPFNEVFIIPYLLWFAYIFITVAYFLFTSKHEFYKLCANLFIGMTICLIIYTIWPNGHYLRVDINSLGRDNIFLTLLSRIYDVDTSTNVFPSIHVFNSVAAFIAINKNERLRKLSWVRPAAFILTVLICMSTVFLKQHSVLDIFGGLALNLFMYAMVYIPSWSKSSQAKQELYKV